jgi:hypothetical protein
MSNLRSKVIRLAHQNPELRPHLLPLLMKTAMEFPTEDARKKYLDEHPDADASKHTVAVSKSEGKGKEEDTSHDKPKGEDKPSPGIAAKFKSFLSKVKGAKADMVKALQAAPAKMQEFVSDPEARKRATTNVANAIKKSPEKLAKHIWEQAKSELKEIKHAGTAVKKLFKKPVEKWNKEDRAAVYSVAVYAAGAALAASGGGPLMAVAGVGKSFAMHVGMKAISHVVDHGFLHFEAGETALHAMHPITEVLKHLVMASDTEVSDEEYQETLVQYLTVAVGEVMAKGISDEDMQAILRGEEPDPETIKQPKAA